MEKQQSIFFEDIESVANASFVPWDKLRNKTVFITGGTGLIGASVIRCLHYASRKMNLNLSATALVRDERKAVERFKDELSDGFLKIVVGTVEEFPDFEGEADYILHAASQTASMEFVSHAAETMRTAVTGTMNLLEFARKKRVKGFVYLSSMEVYGHPKKGHRVTESEIGALSPLELRNSYPIGKIAAEALCCAYAAEYGVPAMVCRLTQTFGPGVNENDTRVFAYFGKCAKEKKNIVLKTKGETERSYLYTTDAVTALLVILLKGKPGHAYNAADESTYCSISEMAEKVAREAGIKVEYALQDAAANGFLDTLYMDMDVSALKALGWRALIRGGRGRLIEMYRRMLADMQKPEARHSEQVPAKHKGKETLPV